MSYSNATYAARVFVNVVDAKSFGTATAGDSTGCILATSAILLPQFPRRTAINKGQLVCTVIPDGSNTAYIAHFVNGTDTFGTAVLTTATAGKVISITIDTDYNTFTAASGPGVKLTGTASASGDALGSFNIAFEQQELFA